MRDIFIIMYNNWDQFVDALIGYRVTIIVILAIVLLVVVGVMAKQKGRDVVPWVVLSFFVSPLIVMFILLCLGMTREERIRRITEEERIRKEIRKSQN